MGEITVRPVGPADFPIIEQLFGPRGACAGCWCMWWRVEKGGKTWEAAQGEPNKRAFRALVEQGRVHGLLAFDGDEPVGWCDLGPHRDYPRLGRARTLQRADGDPAGRAGTWVTPCFFIKAGHRKRGIASRLLAAAIDHAEALGAAEIEAYPVAAGHETPAVFAYTGIATMFEAEDFRPVPATDPGKRSIYRKAVR
jgi:GNAT superfamily N-acetyltransferase